MKSYNMRRLRETTVFKLDGQIMLKQYEETMVNKAVESALLLHQ